MNNLSKTLLGGVAVAALAAAPAMAHKSLHVPHVQALHTGLGHVTNKTKMGNQKAVNLTYTFGVYSAQPASAGKNTHLIYTYYKWNSSFNLCTTPKEKNKAPKKSVYAKIGTATETYSEGCSSGPTVFYGDTWSNKSGTSGETDTFVSTLTGKFKNSGTKYKGTLNLDVSVFIE